MEMFWASKKLWCTQRAEQVVGAVPGMRGIMLGMLGVMQDIQGIMQRPV